MAKELGKAGRATRQDIHTWGNQARRDVQEAWKRRLDQTVKALKCQTEKLVLS